MTASRTDWLLVIVHGPDRRNAPQDDTRGVLFRQIVLQIEQLEQRAGHRRTVVLGDLNANPFEPSVMGAGGLHAIGTQQVRGRYERGIRHTGRVAFFYNPMWRLYGADRGGDAAAATYYHTKGYEAVEPFWHMLDQVLIRPEEANRLRPEDLQILSAAGPTRLTLPDGRPDAEVASDHLPVLFSLV